ncbi:uncharacterized protein [Taeniopygia guttata]|uniref:uncharacterized protein n=1 Tax=Taeniopygia guttata TaxID=59729 RepID=UPI003BB98408
MGGGGSRLAPPPLPPPPPPPPPRRRRRPPRPEPIQEVPGSAAAAIVRRERDPLPAPHARPGPARPGPAGARTAPGPAIKGARPPPGRAVPNRGRAAAPAPRAPGGVGGPAPRRGDNGAEPVSPPRTARPEPAVELAPGAVHPARFSIMPIPGRRLPHLRLAEDSPRCQAGTHQALPLAEQEGDKQPRQEPTSPEPVSRENPPFSQDPSLCLCDTLTRAPWPQFLHWGPEETSVVFSSPESTEWFSK